MINTYYSRDKVNSVLQIGKPSDNDIVDIFCTCCIENWSSQEFVYIDGKGEVLQNRYIGDSNFVNATMRCPECGELCIGINYSGFLTPHQEFDVCEKLREWYKHRSAMDNIEEDLKDWNYLIVDRNFG